MTRHYWLASYPKSGSTWLRLLLANLGRATPADINALGDDGEIASSRDRFDRAAPLPSALLTEDEIEALRPAVHRAVAAGHVDALIDRSRPIGGARFIKAHDAWTTLPDGRALLGDGGAVGAVLAVRDPRAVAVSLAAHLGIGIDAVIAMMADPDAHLPATFDQLRQRLLDWSGHATSWLTQQETPVHVVRYEDLHRDAAGALLAMLGFAGIDTTREECAGAARHAGFDEVRRQEHEHGFREAGDGRFFRSGRIDGWRDQLSDAQADRIVATHPAVMSRFGYSSSST